VSSISWVIQHKYSKEVYMYFTTVYHKIIDCQKHTSTNKKYCNIHLDLKYRIKMYKNFPEDTKKLSRRYYKVMIVLTSNSHTHNEKVTSRQKYTIHHIYHQTRVEKKKDLPGCPTTMMRLETLHHRGV